MGSEAASSIAAVTAWSYPQAVRTLWSGKAPRTRISGGLSLARTGCATRESRAATRPAMTVERQVLAPAEDTPARCDPVAPMFACRGCPAAGHLRMGTQGHIFEERTDTQSPF